MYTYPQGMLFVFHGSGLSTERRFCVPARLLLEVYKFRFRSKLAHTQYQDHALG